MLCRGSSKNLPNNFQVLERLNQVSVNLYVQEGRTVCQLCIKPRAFTCAAPTVSAVGLHVLHRLCLQ